MSDAPKQCNDSRFQCFIEPKNRFYAFDICPGYWEFVIDDFESGNAMSVTHVHNEIRLHPDVHHGSNLDGLAHVRRVYMP